MSTETAAASRVGEFSLSLSLSLSHTHTHTHTLLEPCVLNICMLNKCHLWEKWYRELGVYVIMV